MSADNTWDINGIKIEGRTLKINASPGFGNRKKWEGEFEFHLGWTGEHLRALQQAIEDSGTRERLLEVAKAELDAKRKELQEEYKAHMEKVLKETSLEEDDLPHLYRCNVDIDC